MERMKGAWKVILWDLLTKLDGIEYLEIYGREGKLKETDCWKSAYREAFKGDIYGVPFNILVGRIDRINISEEEVMEVYVSYE